MGKVSENFQNETIVGISWSLVRTLVNKFRKTLLTVKLNIVFRDIKEYQSPVPSSLSFYQHRLNRPATE